MVIDLDEEGFGYDDDPYDDDDGWQAYKDGQALGNEREPEYDGPYCDRCGDRCEVPAKPRWRWPYGVRPCPVCEAPPWWRRARTRLRNWWYWRRWPRLRRTPFDGEAPF